MDPDTPDPTPFFSDFNDAKKLFFSLFFFFLLLTHRHRIFSLKKFLHKFVLNLYLQALFQSAQHTYHKREGSGAGSVPHRIRESQKSADPYLQHCRIKVSTYHAAVVDLSTDTAVLPQGVLATNTEGRGAAHCSVHCHTYGKTKKECTI
jgi:hypothetical protein